ncbi:hypothetical protein [Bacillus paranthracis]|uniref:hypothetical protein n=1 Tax=Bacillus paranthracis TaxID=2026186 RepID=UPI0021CEA284|nr:hypothetical protein [Bacillus paranthracis]MCU5173751.1 hypothetical protein [Bacillus paranthracis]
MKPRRYEYLIAYKWYSTTKKGDGNSFFTSKSKLNSKKDLEDLTKYFKELNDFETVIITNVQLMREKRSI